MTHPSIHITTGSAIGFLALGLFAAPAQAQIVINEIRVDQPSGDDSEYAELHGPAGASLDNVWYLVIGDTGNGTIESASDLSGNVIPGDGIFLIAESTFDTVTFGAVVDLTVAGNGLNFENSDNVTHMLVTNFTGAIGMDIDTNDDCVIDNPMWTSILDLVAMVEEPNGVGVPPAGTECHYGPPGIGPEGTLLPGHVYRTPDGAGPLRAWNMGPFDPYGAGSKDTPGLPNAVADLSITGFANHQTLVLDAIDTLAGGAYIVLGSLSGTSPGTAIGSLTIPLNLDRYFLATLSNPGSGPLTDATGTLSAGNAQGAATFTLPAGALGAAMVGLTVNHAYVANGRFVSNPVSLAILP